MQTIYLKNEEKKDFSKKVIIIGAYCSSDSKIKRLKDILTYIRKTTEKYSIIIVTHLNNMSDEISEIADYVLFNKNNPILNKNIYTEESQRQLVHIITTRGAFRHIVCRPIMYHGYAHHLAIRDGMCLAKSQKSDIVHYINYDVPEKIIDNFLQIEEMLQYDCDLIYYDYEQTGNKMNTEAFSLNGQIIDDVFNDFLSFDDYCKFLGNSTYSTEEIYYKAFEKFNSYSMGIFHNDGRKYPWVIGDIDFIDDASIEFPKKLNSNLNGLHIIPYRENEIGKILLNNSPDTNMPVLKFTLQYENENKDILEEINSDVYTNRWNEFDIPESAAFAKIFVNKSVMAYFDLNDEHNFGFYYTEKL